MLEKKADMYYIGLYLFKSQLTAGNIKEKAGRPQKPNKQLARI